MISCIVLLRLRISLKNYFSIYLLFSYKILNSLFLIMMQIPIILFLFDANWMFHNYIHLIKASVQFV